MSSSSSPIAHINRQSLTKPAEVEIVVSPEALRQEEEEEEEMGIHTGERRESKLLYEGIEYDLSNLMSDQKKNPEKDEEGSLSSSSSSSETSGYLSCRSRATSTPSRNWSNASSVFEQQSKAARRPSPYRFDLRDMQTMMMSFRHIPELSQSFRLNSKGQVLEIDEPTETLGSSARENEEEALYKEEEDLKPAAKPTKTEKEEEEVPGRCSLSTVSTEDSQEEDSKPAAKTTTQEETHQAEEDNGMEDLIFDEATGTYVYKEEYLEQEATYEQQVHQSTEYHDACQTQTEQENRYTLEEMCDSAANGDDGSDYDDDEHEMEISPGVYVPFRGAKETWQAVATHCTVELQCIDCMVNLVCINDCEFTVCPDCRVVNPVFCDDPIGKPFGVGMGFKKEWVLKKLLLQAERERRQSDLKSLVNQASRRRLLPL